MSAVVQKILVVGGNGFVGELLALQVVPYLL